jgi:hypothetical protein
LNREWTRIDANSDKRSMMAGTNLRRIRTFCLKALATPRTRGAIPNCRSTPILLISSCAGYKEASPDDDWRPQYLGPIKCETTATLYQLAGQGVKKVKGDW